MRSRATSTLARALTHARMHPQHSEINRNATLFDGVHGASQAQAMARRG